MAKNNKRHYRLSTGMGMIVKTVLNGRNIALEYGISDGLKGKNKAAFNCMKCAEG